ncbi:P-loop containing nucleoside triphosphate hydrolase protein [Mycena alexandri]|uniref:P-loop containing nucleoside triphosphate hydrolase protein n=1 Tax=Mycena alexandri TaxID=1745969 RepID=A0AAD6T3M0_9AGAR|nr:P-loop containing nucleoside triphosphate hydrolase protein [Mycena alexandri]
MELKPELLRGICASGFQRPFPIQQYIIRTLINGRDVIAHSRAGSGKTVALSIALMQRLNPAVKGPQIVILAHTRELAHRTHALIATLGVHMGVETLLLVGGTNIRADITRLTEGVPVQLIVSTPGRTFEMLRRGALRTDDLKIVCLDEAQEFVVGELQDVILELFELLPRGTQVAALSPTRPADVRALSDKLMRDPLVFHA